MPDKPPRHELAVVGVMSIASRPVPHVPSRKVTCDGCGQLAWLSKATGDTTIAAARQHSDQVRIMCDSCLLAAEEDGTEFSWHVTAQTLLAAEGHRPNHN